MEEEEEVHATKHHGKDLELDQPTKKRDNHAWDKTSGSSSDEDGDIDKAESWRPPPGEWKGKAFRCNVCPDVLCLSSKIMEQHLASKKHRKSLRKIQANKGQVIQAAKGGKMEEETETHAERLRRLKDMNMKREKIKEEEEARKLARKKKKSKGGRQRQKLRAQKKKVKTVEL